MTSYQYNEIPRGIWPNVKGSSIIKPYPTVDTQSRADTRLILRRAWNGRTRQYTPEGKNKWVANGFRAVMNAGDPLGRKNYSCGGPNMVSGGVGRMFCMPPRTLKDGGQRRSGCDISGIPAQTCNIRYVYDSSDVIRYKKELAINKGYSWKNNDRVLGKAVYNMGFDYSYGGSNNGAVVRLRHVRH